MWVSHVPCVVGPEKLGGPVWTLRSPCSHLTPVIPTPYRILVYPSFVRRRFLSSIPSPTFPLHPCPPVRSFSSSSSPSRPTSPLPYLPSRGTRGTSGLPREIWGYGSGRRGERSVKNCGPRPPDSLVLFFRRRFHLCRCLVPRCILGQTDGTFRDP